MNQVETLSRQLEFARRLTLTFLTDLRADDWFRMPQEGVTHIAWQVGHLAVSEAGLIFGRVLDRPPGSWPIPAEWPALFARGSQPVADVSRYPSVELLRDTFDRVHREALASVTQIGDDALSTLVTPPHPAFRDRREAFHFAACHDFIHAGQIGLLRRLLGYAPLR